MKEPKIGDYRIKKHYIFGKWYFEVERYAKKALVDPKMNWIQMMYREFRDIEWDWIEGEPYWGGLYEFVTFNEAKEYIDKQRNPPKTKVYYPEEYIEEDLEDS